ncbi:MAG: PAS domain S-box protein [Anaerolineales bacterium]
MDRSTEEKILRDDVWVSALRATADVARRAVSAETDVIRAVTEELKRLHLRGGVALFTDDGSLEVQRPSLDNALMRSLERLAGISISGYRFDPHDVEVYRRVIETGETVFSSDRKMVVEQMTPPNLRPLVNRIVDMLGDVPVIIAPLILEDKPIGTINVSADWLSEADVAHVAALADHFAISLGHVRARERLEQALETQRLRNQVIEAVSNAVELDEVLERVNQLAHEVLSADATTIAILGDHEQTIRFPHAIGLPESYQERVTTTDTGTIRDLIANRKPQLIADYPSHPDATDEAIEWGVQSLIAVPLIIEDEIIAILALFSSSKERRFTHSDLEQAEAIGSMASIALQNARLYSEASRRADESETLMRTARAISSLLDTDTVLESIAQQANDLLKADGSRIHLLDYETNELNCMVALEPNAEAIMKFPIRVGEGLTGHVVETGEPLIINNPVEDQRGIQVPGTPEDESECLAIVPLSVRHRIMGAMTVRRLGLKHPFTDSDLNLLSAFAAQAAVSIENAHLYGQIEAQAQRLEIQVEERTRDLALSEARYRSLVETAQAGIFQLDLDGTLLYVNKALAEMAGELVENLIGKKFFQTSYLSEDTKRNNLDNLNKRLRGELPETDTFETVFTSKTGKKIPAIVGVSVIRDDTGKPRGLTGLVTDISERIKLEEELEAERDRLDAMLTHVGDGVMLTDADRKIQFVNPAWEQLNGYTAEEVLGRDPSILQSGKHGDEFYEQLHTEIYNGEVWEGEVLNQRKDGSTYDGALTITPVKDQSGEIINFVSVLHDISALKEVDRLKTQFVSDVSHELRTPLTNIRLYLDLLKRVKDEEKVTRYLETLSRESNRLANLIDDLLSLSRLDVGEMPLRKSNVDINHLLDSLAEDRKSLASRKGLQIQLEMQDSLPPLLGDERLLGQIFTNLLTNAMNYSLEGGEITLRTRHLRVEEQDWVIAEVEDTGIGIPQNEQVEIFQRFFRGEASRRTGAPGTGLGLAICQEIAKRHGGHIHVTSEGVPGKGTQFSVWLPAASREELSSF